MENTIQWSDDQTHPGGYYSSRTPRRLEELNTPTVSTDNAPDRTHVVNSLSTSQREVSPVSGTHRASPIRNIGWKESPPSRSKSPYPPLGTLNTPYIQKLEGLKSKSPERKLEKLKDRIREQRRRLARVSPGPHGSGFWEVNEAISKSSLRRTVRKVTFAPPPPVYRGFSSVNMELSRINTDDILKPVAEDQDAARLKYGEHTAAATQIQANERKENHLKGKPKHGEPEKSTSNLSKASQKERDQVTNLYGASAWRQGQRLVRKLLGPPPEPLKPTSAPVHEPETTKHESDHDLGDSSKAMKDSTNAKIPRKQLLETTAALQANQEESIQLADCKLAKDSRQVLGPLYSHNQHTDHCKSPNPQSHIAIPNGSPEEQGRLPKDVVLETEVNPRKDSGRRGKNASPQHGRTSSLSPLGEHDDKENIPQCTETKLSTRKVRSYSVEEVRKFMNRKVAERHKKELEAKKAKKKASELKNKRMEELFQKQKEAFPKRERSRDQQMGNKPASQAPNEGQACSRNPEKDVSEWVHLTSQALLEGEASEGSVFDSKKSRVELNKERKTGLKLTFVLPSETQIASPLRRKDLDCSEQSPPKGLTFFRRLQCSDLKSVLPESSSQLKVPFASSQLSPSRSKEERILAIHAVAKELEERIQVEADRLRMTNSQHRANEQEKASALQGSVHDPLVKPDRFQNELNRMLSQIAPSQLPTLEELKMPLNNSDDSVGAKSQPSGGRAQLIIVKQDTKQTTACTLLPCRTKASEQHPWSSDPDLLTNDGRTQHAEDMLQSPMKVPQTTFQSNPKQESPAVTCSESLSWTRSPQRKAAEHGGYGSMDTSTYVNNSEMVKLFYPPGKDAAFADDNNSALYENKIKNNGKKQLI